jgi:hypothetical protein
MYYFANEKKRNLVLAYFCILLGICSLSMLNYFYLDLKLPCIFKSVTGLPCPGCGLTRASAAVLQRKWELAFYYNPLVFPLAFALCIIGVGLVWDWKTEKRAFASMLARLERQQPRYIYILFILLLLTHWAWSVYKGI